MINPYERGKRSPSGLLRRVGELAPLELPLLRKQLGAGIALVTPGIRPADAALDDQNRVLTPAEAARFGASHIVVGRPILRASDPAAVAAAIRREIGEIAK